MAVRWPDGSFTGSVLVTPAPTPVAEPEPVETIVEPETVPVKPTTEPSFEKKEVAHGDR